MKPAYETRDALDPAYLAHELRAPLTSIGLTLAMLQEELSDRLGREQQQYLDVALKNVKTLGEIVNDIMDFCKIQAGKLAVETKPASPALLIRDAVEAMAAMALSRQVRLKFRVQGSLPHVKADARRASQVLVNLLSNAVKYSPAGATVEVSARAGAGAEEGKVVFSVKDEGRGIAAENLPRMFGFFEQAAADVQAAQGTGLGLALAKVMVELQSGKIWVDSVPGQGATFSFTLPADEPELS